MATLGQIATWVAQNKLQRPDVEADVIELCEDALISICSKVPFDELRTIGSELSITSGQGYVDISAVTPAIAGIISVRYTKSSTVKRMLMPTVYEEFHNRVLSSGEPARYARVAKKLYFDKTPNASGWTIQLYYWSLPTISAQPTDTTLPWSQEWDELLKYETLYRAYIHVEEHMKAAMLMGPSMMPRQASPKRIASGGEIGIIPRLWNDCLRTIGSREGIHSSMGINPIIRGYGG